MTPENRRAALDVTKLRIPPSPVSTYRTALTLARVGTRRCRLAAAFVAMVVGLASQIGNQAVAQAKQAVLYLDAPAVSAERATQAGKVADSYATPGSPASPEVLTWLEIPTRPVDASPPTEGNEEAFASITAPDGEEGGVTPSAALLAGRVMLAQLEASTSDEENEGSEFVSADAVRPQLGDGTRAPEAEPEVADPDSGREQPGEAGSTLDEGAPAYASTLGASASGEEPSIVPEEAPPAELASVPADANVKQVPDAGTGEEVYGPTGPVSNPGQVPVSLVTGSPEGRGDEVEQLYPEESVPTEEPDTGDEELAGSGPTAEDIGPTGGEGSEVALMPVSLPAAEEEPATTEEDSETDGELAPPSDAGGSEIGYAEPSPSEGTPEEPSGTDAPKDIATELPADESGEEQVEIVVVSGGTPLTETPARAPSGQQPPTGRPRPADVLLPEAPLGREEAGEGAPAEEQGPSRDDDIEQGQPPSEELPVEQPPAGEGVPVEQPPADVPSDEEQPLAEEGSPPADVPGGRDAASQSSMEGRQTGGEQPEGPKDTAPPSGNEASGTPRPEDRVPANPREGGRYERHGEDSQRKVGPRGDEDRNKARLTDLAGQLGNDGGGEQRVVVETNLSSGGAGVSDLLPEPPTRTVPQATEELIAAERLPRVAHASAQVMVQQAAVERVGWQRVAAPAAEGEQAATERYAAQKLVPAPQPTPASALATSERDAAAPISERAAVDRTTVPEDVGNSLEGVPSS